MERRELEKQIQGRHVGGVYLFDGTEEYLKQRALSDMIRVVCEGGMEELNSTTLENPSANELIAACETIPFMSEKRIVVVPDAPYLTGRSEADDKLKDYLVHLPPFCVLVFYCHGKVDARKGLVKQIAKSGAYVTFSAMDENELNAWICAQFKEAGKNCSQQVASQLVFVAGSDATLLMGEIGKLVGHSGEAPEITMEDIQAVTTRSSEYAAFEIVNAVMDNQESRAFALMRDMLAAGESRIGILAMLERQCRMLQHVSIMRYEKKSMNEMTVLLGMKSFVINKYLQQLRQLTPKQVRESVKLCIDTEFRIKSGQLNQEGALEAMMIRLFEMRRAGAK